MSSNAKQRKAVQKNKIRKSGKARKRAARAEVRKAREAKVDVL